jgi:hypothetical protein
VLHMLSQLRIWLMLLQLLDFGSLAGRKLEPDFLRALGLSSSIMGDSSRNAKEMLYIIPNKLQLFFP